MSTAAAARALPRRAQLGQHLHAFGGTSDARSAIAGSEEALSTTAAMRTSERSPQCRASRLRTTALWQSTRVLVTPCPGVDRRHLLDTLRSVHTDVANLQGGSYSRTTPW